jgi:tetrahydromethanopterin S-methyltransferase subunit B
MDLVTSETINNVNEELEYKIHFLELAVDELKEKILDLEQTLEDLGVALDSMKNKLRE